MQTTMSMYRNRDIVAQRKKKHFYKYMMHNKMHYNVALYNLELYKYM